MPRRTFGGVAALAVAVAGVTVATSPRAQEPRAASALEARVDAHLRPYLDTANFSGSVLVARNGEILLSKGYGRADVDGRTPNGPRTAYYLASTSRVFTSAAIMLLAQQGKLSVDDPLSKHLPEWPRGDEITIHHLLTLSAGFPDINSLRGYGLWSMSPQTPASLAARFRDLPLEFEPGEQSVHSNSNYTVLALLIERLSGRTYGEFLAQEFFEPLGMTRTAHDDHPDRPVAYRALGYRPRGYAELGRHTLRHWSVKTGNASIYSTTEDLYRLDRALANATVVDGPGVDAMFVEHYPSNGYGWFVGERFGSSEVYINGRSPGFGSYWGRSVDGDVTAIVLGNIYNGAPNAIGRDLIAMALGEDVEPPTIRADPPDPTVLAELVGAYQFGPDFYRPNGLVTFRVDDGHLFNGSDWVMPAGTDDLTFVHRVYWSDLEFVRDSTGRVTALRYDDFVGTRTRD